MMFVFQRFFDFFFNLFQTWFGKALAFAMPLLLWLIWRAVGDWALSDLLLVSVIYPLSPGSLSQAAWQEVYRYCEVIGEAVGPVISLIALGVMLKAGTIGKTPVYMARFAVVASGFYTMILLLQPIWPITLQKPLAANVWIFHYLAPGLIGFVLAALIGGYVGAYFTRSPKKFRINEREKKDNTRIESGPWKADFMPIDEAVASFSSKDGVVLGEAYRHDRDPAGAGTSPLLRWGPKAHLLTIAGSGAGKGISVVIPNALLWNKALVINDPAGETLAVVRKAREGMGRRVVVLDAGNPDGFGMNVLDWIDPSRPKVIEDAQVVVDWLDSSKEGQAGSDNQFRIKARDLVEMLLLYVLCNPDYDAEHRTLAMVRQLQTDGRLKQRIKQLASNKTVAFGRVADLAGDLLETMESEKTFASILFNAGALTSFIHTPTTRRLICAEGVSGDKRFETAELFTGETDVFVKISVSLLEAQPGLARAIFGALITSMYEEGERRKGRLPDTLFLLDEMPRLGRLTSLKTARDYARKYGVILWAVAQDLGQLEEAWGKAGMRGWLASAAIKQFFGVADYETAKYVSDQLGSYTAKQESITEGSGGARQFEQVMGSTSDNFGRSTQGTKVELMSPDQVMSMRATADGVALEQIVLKRGKQDGGAAHGDTGFAIRCGMAHYFRHPRLSKLADKNPFASAAE